MSNQSSKRAVPANGDGLSVSKKLAYGDLFRHTYGVLMKPVHILCEAPAGMFSCKHENSPPDRQSRSIRIRVRGVVTPLTTPHGVYRQSGAVPGNGDGLLVGRRLLSAPAHLVVCFTAARCPLPAPLGPEGQGGFRFPPALWASICSGTFAHRRCPLDSVRPKSGKKPALGFGAAVALRAVLTPRCASAPYP